MRIILVRHGKPELPSFPWTFAKQFKDWIQIYNSASLCHRSNPSDELRAIASGCSKVVCSNLLRSTESANKLGCTHIHINHSRFREMDLPYFSITGLKLPPALWSVIFRVLWFCGFSKNCESFSDAKLRAKAAALELEEIAKRYGSVLFVGHNFLNRYVAKYLRSTGWGGPDGLSSDYWSYTTFEFED